MDKSALDFHDFRLYQAARVFSKVVSKKTGNDTDLSVIYAVFDEGDSKSKSALCEHGSNHMARKDELIFTFATMAMVLMNGSTALITSPFSPKQLSTFPCTPVSCAAGFLALLALPCMVTGLARAGKNLFSKPDEKAVVLICKKLEAARGRVKSHREVQESLGSPALEEEFGPTP